MCEAFIELVLFAGAERTPGLSYTFNDRIVPLSTGMPELLGGSSVPVPTAMRAMRLALRHCTDALWPRLMWPILPPY